MVDRMTYRNEPSEPKQFRKPPSSASADPGQTQASQACMTLSTIMPLLDAFNHRHHNQHRTSHWWAAFGILRRNLRNLAKCLDQPAVDSSRRHSRNRTDHAVIRASWLNTHVLPRAFIAFSQLAADNQHAPLGLFLLTVLSQVHGFLPGMLPQNPGAVKAKLPTQTFLKTSSPNLASVISTQHTDRGVVVSREVIIRPGGDDVMDSESMRRGRDDIKSHVRGISKQDRERDKKPKKKKKKAGDELSSLFSSL